MHQPDKESILDEKPPFFKNWKKIYQLVIGIHALLILLFYWFTLSYS